MLFEYFKSNNNTTALPTTTKSHLITFTKCRPALNQYNNKRCGCFYFYNHTSCFLAKRKTTKQCCCLYGLALRRKIRKTSRRKRKYRRRGRRRRHDMVVINNRHYNNNNDNDDVVDVDNNNEAKTKEKKIDNETVQTNNTNCVNITTTRTTTPATPAPAPATATTTATTTTTTSSIKCKQSVNNTKRKTFSCSLKTKKKTIKQCHNNCKRHKDGSSGRCKCESSIANIKSSNSISCCSKTNTNCYSKSCCSSNSSTSRVAKNNCCHCKMNLIVKNLVTLLLPKITVAKQTTKTTQTTIITSKLAHITTTAAATPKATIKCLRECCTMATATPTATTPRLLTVQNNVRENILNNVTATKTTTIAEITTEMKNVQLHATKENMRQQHQHQHQHQHQFKYLNALGKCVKIATKQQQQEQQQHVNKTSVSSNSSSSCRIRQPNTLPLYQQQQRQQQTTAKIQTSFPTFTKNKIKISTSSSSLLPSSSLSSSSSSSSLSPAAASNISSSSCTWYRHSSSNSSSRSTRPSTRTSTSTSTSSRLARLIAPTRLLNELYGIIFMTLLVLSICHNNVLETSAASVKISRREIVAALAPASVSASVSVSASTPRVVKQAIMSSGEAESPFNQRQHSPEQISAGKAQSYFSQDEQPHQPLEQDKRRQTVDEREMQMETETETEMGNSNNIFQPQIQPQYLPTYQQHYQQHHLTTPTTTRTMTTTTTSFSHGMALETTYNHTFQSLSIIDGDLAVSVVDTSHHQNIMTVEEEMLMAAAGGAPGVGSSSLSLDDFHLHDNVLSSYDATSTGLDGAAGIDFTHHHAVANSMPIFDFGMPRNITARTGHTEAVIKCRVDRLDDKSVSWIRKRDLHILTVGTATYTSDKRFQVTESKDSREWTLHVKSPQARDSGIYECQVNTEPKMSMAFQLNVIEISPDAKAVITGPADLHFKVGSAIILTCIVHQPSVKDIGPIYWYRGEYMITPFDINDNNHDVSTGAGIDDTVTQNKVNVLEQNRHTHTHTHHQHNAGIYGAGTGANVGGGGGGSSSTSATDAEQQPQILTNEITQDFAQRIAMESQLGDTMKSRLRISNAQTSDTGNYTCQPTTASSASVMVHVINDENPAAMQKSGASSNNNKRQENLMPLLSATLLLTIASAMASLLNMAVPARAPAPAIRNGNEWWLSTAITTALLAKTITTMRFTIEIIKSYIMSMLSYHHLHSDVISMLQGIDLIQQQQQQQRQLIIVMVLQPRQHELWWYYYSKWPCYRIHNNILRNSYANNNNNNGDSWYIIVVIRGYLVSHPAYDIISYSAITVTDTVTDTDSDNDTVTATTSIALCCVAEIVCRLSVEPAYEHLRGLQNASIKH